MGLILICPKCNKIISGRSCSECDYRINNEEILLEKVINEYNKALQLAKHKRLLEAWNIIRNAVIVFPYIVKPLEFAFYLSIEVGEYQQANNYFNQIKSYLTIETQQDMKDLLLKNVNVYNDILNNNFVDYNNLEDLSYVHLILLKLKKDTNIDRNKIIRGLEEFNTYSVTNNNKKFNKIALWITGAALIVSIIFILIIINKENIYKNELYDKNQDLNNFTEQIVLLENEITNKKELDSLLFSINDVYQNGNYKSCADLIIAHQQVIKRIKELKLTNILEDISENLYYTNQFDLVMKMEYKSEFTPHAFFRKLMREVESDNDRLKNIELFVKEYPLYKYYTAPLLKELFDYYRPIDSLKALEYAVRLKEYVLKNSSEKYKQWFTQEVRAYAEKGE